MSKATLVIDNRQMGAYHTIDIQLNQRLTLAKLQWDVISLDRLGERYIDISLVTIVEQNCHVIHQEQRMSVQ